MRQARLTSPAIGRRHDDESFDFGAEADAAIAVRLIANVYNTGVAVSFLGFIARDFGRHAQTGFDRHADLKRRRRSEVKSALRNV